MVFTRLGLKDAYLIDLEPIGDQRGFFARAWCRKEFSKMGLHTDWVQCNLSFNHQKGTLRGLHYQTPPSREIKLVRCIRGTAYDVIVDLRNDSPTYNQWEAVELSADNRRALYIPLGFAHGFQTLEDHTEMLYHMSEFYNPACAKTIRWDHPRFGIRWPEVENRILSEKDRNPDG